jgi:hypothetical protein
MKIFWIRSISGIFVTIEFLVSQVSAAPPHPQKAIPAPAKLKEKCTNSGLGGKVCPYKVYLTAEQLQTFTGQLSPSTSIPTPAKRKETCTDSGFGGQICPYRVYLTPEQLKTAQQFHLQNVKTMRKNLQIQKSAPK